MYIIFPNDVDLLNNSVNYFLEDSYINSGLSCRSNLLHVFFWSYPCWPCVINALGLFVVDSRHREDRKPTNRQKRLIQTDQISWARWTGRGWAVLVVVAWQNRADVQTPRRRRRQRRRTSTTRGIHHKWKSSTPTMYFVLSRRSLKNITNIASGKLRLQLSWRLCFGWFCIKKIERSKSVFVYV